MGAPSQSNLWERRVRGRTFAKSARAYLQLNSLVDVECVGAPSTGFMGVGAECVRAPSPKPTSTWTGSSSSSPLSLAEVCASPDLSQRAIRLVLADLQKLGISHGLKAWEIPQTVVLLLLLLLLLPLLPLVITTITTTTTTTTSLVPVLLLLDC